MEKKMKAVPSLFLTCAAMGVMIAWAGHLPAVGQCPVTQGTMPADAVPFDLPVGTKFKIKVDTPLNSSPNNKNDLVQFTVLENVYGVSTAVTKAVAKDFPAGQRHRVIPKDTKAFGRVHAARGRSPFWIKGKAFI